MPRCFGETVYGNNRSIQMLKDEQLGAWLQELPLGKRISLAMSTIVTALLCWVFLLVESENAIRITTVGISLSASTMWAILYGWTPAIFSTNGKSQLISIFYHLYFNSTWNCMWFSFRIFQSVRSFLSIIIFKLTKFESGGIMAPLVGGWLLVIDKAFPVYASVAILLASSFAVLCLKDQPVGSSDGAQQALH